MTDPSKCLDPGIVCEIRHSFIVCEKPFCTYDFDTEQLTDNFHEKQSQHKPEQSSKNLVFFHILHQV